MFADGHERVHVDDDAGAVLGRDVNRSGADHAAVRPRRAPRYAVERYWSGHAPTPLGDYAHRHFDTAQSFPRFVRRQPSRRRAGAPRTSRYTPEPVNENETVGFGI